MKKRSRKRMSVTTKDLDEFIDDAERRFNDIFHSQIDVTKVSIYQNDESSFSGTKPFYRDIVRGPIMDLQEEGIDIDIKKGSNLPKLVAKKSRQLDKDEDAIKISKFYESLEQSVRETLR